MFYTLLTSTVTILVLTVLTSYLLVREAIPDKVLRKTLLFFVIVTPPITVYVFIRSLFLRPKPIRYNTELGKIEDEIESERVKIFGGKILHPSFSERWKISYLYAVQKMASKIDSPLASALRERQIPLPF